jgi:hypothetical protein
MLKPPDKASQSPDPQRLVSLNQPDLLNIPLPLNLPPEAEPTTLIQAFGCDQEWYQDHWQRKAGCGPCTSATILYYLARTHAGCERLYGLPLADGNQFRLFMDQIWHFVTPGRMGVNESGMLTDGVTRFAGSRQVHLSSHVFEVPGAVSQRRSFSDFRHFIQAGLELDSPVAFLNLSNGHLENLDSWHWVTITALLQDRSGCLLAELSDSGEKKHIDLTLWYDTTYLGGAAVYFVPAGKPGTVPVA